MREVLGGWKELTSCKGLDGLSVGQVQLEDDLVGYVEGRLGRRRDKVPDFGVGYVNCAEKVGTGGGARCVGVVDGPQVGILIWVFLEADWTESEGSVQYERHHGKLKKMNYGPMKTS